MLVRASTVNSSDVFVRSGIPNAPVPMWIAMRLMIGVTRPRRPILGLVLAGEVEVVGAAVARFQPGDRVWAFTIDDGEPAGVVATARRHLALSGVPDSLQPIDQQSLAARLADLAADGWVVILDAFQYFTRRVILRRGSDGAAASPGPPTTPR